MFGLANLKRNFSKNLPTILNFLISKVLIITQLVTPPTRASDKFFTPTNAGNGPIPNSIKQGKCSNIFGNSGAAPVAALPSQALNQLPNPRIIPSMPNQASVLKSLLSDLPPKFRGRVAHDMAIYIAQHSPHPDALDRASELYFKYTNEDKAPQTERFAQTILEMHSASGSPYRGNTSTKALNSPLQQNILEHLVRLNPYLSEIFRSFGVPGFEAGRASYNDVLKALETQLVNYDPVQAQFLLFAITEQVINNPSDNINPYALSILVDASTNLASNSPSKALARELQQMVFSNSVIVDTDNYVRRIRNIIKNSMGSRFESAFNRWREAIKATFSHSGNSNQNFWIPMYVYLALASINSGMHILMRPSFEAPWQNVERHNFFRSQRVEGFSNLFPYYFEHWQVQIYSVGIALFALSAKTMYHFFKDLRNPHPGDYLLEETNFHLQTMRDDLAGKQADLLRFFEASALSPVQSPVQSPAQSPLPSPLIVNHEAEPQTPPKEIDFANAPLDDSSAVIQPNTQSKPRLSMTEVKNLYLQSPKQESLQSPLSLTTEQEPANRSLQQYFAEANQLFPERATLFNHILVGLLLPFPVNIQLLGESGVAKTSATSTVLGGITDSNGRPSLYRLQMGANTTIGDLLGIVQQSGLKEDRLIRASHRALPGHELAILDEHYRAPDYTREELLTLQAEGKVTFGGENYESKGRMTIYTSNDYPAEVFIKAGNDKPRAEMDRMLFTHLVAPMFEHDSHMIDLPNSKPVMKSQLTFAQIDELKKLTAQVAVPKFLRAEIKLIVNRLRAIELQREHSSRLEWIKRQRNGEVLFTPPYFMTRVLSPRSEHKAYQLLQAFALAEWLSNTSDQPQVRLKHLERLVEFFVDNGPSDKHIERILREYPEGSVPHHQFSQLKKRRDDSFQLIFDINKEVQKAKPMTELFALLTKLDTSRIFANSIKEMNMDQANRWAQSNPLNDSQAIVLQDLVEWHKQVKRRISNRGKIQEISIDDVAMYEAEHLGGFALEILFRNEAP